MSNYFVEVLKDSAVSTNKDTYYANKEAIEARAKAFHLACYEQNRLNYGALMLFPITDNAKLKIASNLLRAGVSRGMSPSDEEVEWALLAETHLTLPISRVLNRYCQLIHRNNGDKGVSNSRSSRVGKMLWRNATPFQIIKYRSKYKAIARYCHLLRRKETPVKQELLSWLFGDIKNSSDVLCSRELESFLKANEGDRDALNNLPKNVAQGIATRLGITGWEQDNKVFSKQEKLSALKQRTVASSAVDWTEYDLLELIRHCQKVGYSVETKEAIATKAKQEAANITIPNQTAFIVDDSASMQGSKDRAGFPIAIGELIVELVLAYMSLNETSLLSIRSLTGDISSLMDPSGETDLRIPVAEAIAQGAKRIAIVSDGYENRGSLREITGNPFVKREGIEFYHINPVQAAETSSVRQIKGTKPILFSGMQTLRSGAGIMEFENNPYKLDALLEEVVEQVRQGELGKAKQLASLKGRAVNLLEVGQ